MVRYCIRRLLAAIPVLVAASLFCFLLIDISGDPVADLRFQQPPVAGDVIAAEEARLYLDRSMPERYVIWMTGIGSRGDAGLLKGQFGPSARSAGFDVKVLAVSTKTPAELRRDGQRVIGGSNVTPSQVGVLAEARTLAQNDAGRTLQGSASDVRPPGGLRAVLVALAAIAAVAIVAATVLTWFLPMVWLTGGLDR